MIAIADSGSTKTDWAFISANAYEKRVQTAGLNPYFLAEHEIKDVLEKDLLPFINPKAITHVFFYGAGCAAAEKSAKLNNALSDFFHGAFCNVYTDIEGVINSTNISSNGIAAILGTGANACSFYGTKVLQQAPSLGYILGDEGSGAHIGKAFIKAYLSGYLSSNLLLEFENSHKISREILLDHIYRRSFPNRYLASFCNWIAQHTDDTFI